MTFLEFGGNVLLALGLIWLSTIFHEIGHLLMAKKHNLRILKNKKEIIKNNQGKDLLKCSIVIFGVELTPYVNAQAHFDKNGYDNLKFDSKKQIAIGGHIFDFIIFVLICIFTFLINFVNLWIYGIYLLMIIFVIMSHIFCKNGDIYKIRKKTL